VRAATTPDVGIGPHGVSSPSVGDWAVAQLWLFWIAPIIGALLGAVSYRLIASDEG